jgi:hypothetical protein
MKEKKKHGHGHGYHHHGGGGDSYDREHLRLEAVTVSVGFDDLLDETLQINHPHLDTMIVVTAHDDKATHHVCRKHGVICVHSDLIKKNGRNFNKGAAVNAGFMYFQYHGWRLHLDSDIALPDNFRRLVFNHHHLDRSGIYGADRVDVIGRKEVKALRAIRSQHEHNAFIAARYNRAHSPRYLDRLRGYIPIGYFQLWNASCQKPYPYSLGTAGHDDVMFASLWPEKHRHLLPGVIVYHLCSRPPSLGENWDGHRRQPRL